jgi:hypothetical protein
MRDFELWLDESGDFEAETQRNRKLNPSLIGGILLSIVPIAYVVLKLGGSPESVYIVHLVICLIAFLTRLWVIKPMIKLSMRQYFANVVLPCFGVMAVSVLLSMLVKNLLPVGIFSTVIVCLSSALFVLILTYVIGLTAGERDFVKNKTIAILQRVRQ